MSLCKVRVTMSQEQIRNEVHRILEDADLETTTSRSVRKQVAAKLQLTEEESEGIRSVVEVSSRPVQHLPGMPGGNDTTELWHPC